MFKDLPQGETQYETDLEAILVLAHELDFPALNDWGKGRVVALYHAARKPLEQEVVQLKESYANSESRADYNQEEGRQLRQQLAEKDAEIERLKEEADSEVQYFRGELASAQAQIAKLQNGLKTAGMNCVDDCIAAGALRIADQPTDTSALESMIAKAGEVMRERAIGAVTWPFDAPTIRGEIRALPGVTLADIPR